MSSHGEEDAPSRRERKAHRREAESGGAPETGEAGIPDPVLAALEEREAKLDCQLDELDVLQRDLEAAPTEDAAADPVQPSEAKTARELELEAQLTAAEQRADEAETASMRIAADYENLRRRTDEQLAQADERANENAAGNLITMADDLRRALEHSDTTQPDHLVDGVRMLLDRLDSVLASMGVKEMEGEGAAFDPNLHEALAAEPSADVSVDTVSQVYMRGYLIASKSDGVEKVLRPAKVVVKQPLTGAPEQPEVG